MRVTLKMIAEEAGVSQMTVSRILNDKAAGQVSDAVRERVRGIVERRGYNPGRTFYSSCRPQQSRFSRDKRVFFLCPGPSLEYLDSSSDNVHAQVFQEISKIADRQGLHVEPIRAFTSQSSIPNWEELNQIRSGEVVLTLDIEAIKAIICLQRRGCRIGVLLRDLAWREFFAPQLQNMACFVIKTADSISRSTKMLLDSGCSRVACVVAGEFMYEPNYPVLLGYDHARSLCGSRFRYPVVVRINAPESFSGIGAAYEKQPFDGLVMHYNPLLAHFGERGNLHRFLGLPDSVRIIVRKQNNEILPDAYAMIEYPYRQLIGKAMKVLTASQFSPVEIFGDCAIRLISSAGKQSAAEISQLF